MENYNSSIHHRRSIRMKGYDYSQAGLYFITLCVQNKECLFGEIHDGEMMWNDAGKTANQYWLEIPKHFPNVVLHAYIVMPNHIHGVIELMDLSDEQSIALVGAEYFPPLIIPHGDGAENIPHGDRASNIPHGDRAENIPPLLGSIVKGFKIGVTKWFRNTFPDDFPQNRSIWQRNYFEHIIRDEVAYHNITNYIIHNPAKWEDDIYNA